MRWMVPDRWDSARLVTRQRSIDSTCVCCIPSDSYFIIIIGFRRDSALRRAVVLRPLTGIVITVFNTNTNISRFFFFQLYPCLRYSSGPSRVSLVIPRGLPDSSGIGGYFTSRYQFRIGLWGILHPDTSFVPSIPEESGIQRGMTSEGHYPRSNCKPIVPVFQKAITREESFIHFGSSRITFSFIHY
jgi:hypothetical protein